MDLAVRGLTISRSFGSSGLPLRQTMRVPPDLDPFLNPILHLHLVFFGQNNDARPALIFVRDHQFVQDGENLRRPAQHQCVIRFEYTRASLTQMIHLPLDGVAQHADQVADHEYASQRDKQHHEAEARTGIPAHGAGVQCSHQAAPEGFPKREMQAVLLRDAKRRDERPR